MTRLVSLLLAALPVAAFADTNGVSSALNLARQLNEAFVEVAEKASPSVVVIKLAHKPGSSELDDEDHPFWDLIPKDLRKQFEEERKKSRKEYEEESKSSRVPRFDGRGSGVIIREDGYIMTNFHVVDEAEKIQVRLLDGRSFEATVRGKDELSDIAVIKIDATNLPVARLGDSAAVRVGEFAIAIGAPFDLDYSVTFGHVSAKGRSVIPSMGINSQGARMDQDFIQTDASINPGNSGGPLVNLYGEVIGINTLIRGLRTGIGFAVPVNLAKEVAEKLISDGKFPRLWLGIGIRGLHEDNEDDDEKISGVENGVFVTKIRDDGPARNSDLRERDVIIAVDGKSVATSTQLRNEIRRKKPGSAVSLDIMRQGKPMKIKVHPDLWPEETDKKRSQ